MINPNNLCPGCMNEKVTEGKCPICGYNPEEPVNPSLLKPGSMLDARYCIGKVIDQNGEGVTYLGYDTVTAITVNIREFFPQGLCERDIDGATVIMLSGSEFSYNDALVKFVELSRELFKLNELPALFDVLDVRESNNTAYRITRNIPGISLREFLMRNGGVLKWDQARSLFAPLVASISALHKAGIVHRGISPDTLIVGKDGKLRLKGFCITECRTAKSTLSSQLFPGFAAVEQYGVAGTQGPWTDIYAFAATIYRTLVGNPPPEATARLQNDNMTIPAKIARETPKAVLETLANALQVLPNDRTQSIDQMRRGLSVSSAQVAAQNTTVNPLGVGVGVGAGMGAGMAAGMNQGASAAPVMNNMPNASAPVPYTNAPVPNQTKKKKKKKSSGKMYGLVAGIVTAFLLAVVIFIIYYFGTMQDSSGSGNKDIVSSGSNISDVLSNFSSQQETSKLEITETGKIKLPSFVGQLYTSAITKDEYRDDIRFKIVSKQYSEEYNKGEIISQNPKPGDAVEIGTTIEVVVSLGPSSLVMPDVTGNDQMGAIMKLVDAGFPRENIVIGPGKYDDTKTQGQIILTDPAPGMTISVDTIITLTPNLFMGIDSESSTPDNSTDDYNDPSDDENLENQPIE